MKTQWSLTTLPWRSYESPWQGRPGKAGVGGSSKIRMRRVRKSLPTNTLHRKRQTRHSRCETSTLAAGFKNVVR